MSTVSTEMEWLTPTCRLQVHTNPLPSSRASTHCNGFDVDVSVSVTYLSDLYARLMCEWSIQQIESLRPINMRICGLSMATYNRIDPPRNGPIHSDNIHGKTRLNCQLLVIRIPFHIYCGFVYLLIWLPIWFWFFLTYTTLSIFWPFEYIIYYIVSMLFCNIYMIWLNVTIQHNLKENTHYVNKCQIMLILLNWLIYPGLS